MNYVITIISALLLVSCSVKKRTYRDGYYMDWAFKKKSASEKRAAPLNVAPVKESEAIEIISASSQKNLDVSLASSNKFVLLNDTCGDMIVFKSGDEVLARVTEITDDKIKYKRCDNLDGPVFVVNKGTVLRIKYSNGVVENIDAPAESVYTPKTNSTPNDAFYGAQKVHPLSGWSLVAWLAGPFTLGLGWIASLLMANKAIREVSLNPKKWRGLMLAKVVKALSLVCITLFVIGVIALISGI